MRRSTPVVAFVVLLISAAAPPPGSQAQIMIGGPRKDGQALVGQIEATGNSITALRADYHDLVNGIARDIIALLGRHRAGTLPIEDPRTVAEWRQARLARISSIEFRANEIAVPSRIDDANISIMAEEKGSNPAALVAEARLSVSRSVTAAKPAIVALINAVAAARSGDPVQLQALPALYYDTVVLMLEDTVVLRKNEARTQPATSERYWLTLFKQAQAEVDLKLSTLRRDAMHGRPVDKNAAVTQAQAHIVEMEEAHSASAQIVRKMMGRLPSGIRNQARSYFERLSQYMVDYIALQKRVLQVVSDDPSGAPSLVTFNQPQDALSRTSVSLEVERQQMLLDAMAF